MWSRARNEHRAATKRRQTLRGQVSDEWGTGPADADRLSEWVGRVAANRAEADPRVSEAAQTVEAATADQQTMRKRHEREHMALLSSEYGAERVCYDRASFLILKPHQKAEDARTRAALTRAEADELRSLPVSEAAERIEAKRAEQEQIRQRAAERAQHLHDPFEHGPHRHDPRREGPTLGL